MNKIIFQIKQFIHSFKKKKMDISVIPKGMYCYSPLNYKNGKYYIKICPYWSLNENKPKQVNGYCSYLGYGDWEVDNLSLLWDQCKECHIKDD